jgi:hypothetical protein
MVNNDLQKFNPTCRLHECLFLKKGHSRFRLRKQILNVLSQTLNHPMLIEYSLNPLSEFPKPTISYHIL